MLKKLLLLALLIPAISCTKVYDNDNDRNVTQPVVPKALQIEYRVVGTASSVIIRYINSGDGLNQTQTALPFTATVSVNQDTVFLSLEAAAQAFGQGSPFMVAQIFVNGQLFREASTTNFFTPLLVSGTYRR